MQKISTLKIRSKSLEGNPLGDPAEREVIVFAPEKIRDGAPLLIGIAGFGGSARSFLNYSPITQNFTDIMAELRDSGALKDAVIALPDGYTSFGGSQYINSSAVGNYEDFIVKELVPFLKSEFSTGKTAVFGKSSGGFGAYTLAVRNPDVFSGFADHSGDAGFEYNYMPDFPFAHKEFRKKGGVAEWYNHWKGALNKSSSSNMKTINILAMSAFYSPNKSSPDMGIDLPFDMDTGLLRDAVWDRWQKWDPARNIGSHLEHLGKMDAVYLDVGSEDEFNINIGMRHMSKVLKSNSVDHYFEEFEDGHFSISYRYRHSLPFLVENME